MTAATPKAASGQRRPATPTAITMRAALTDPQLLGGVLAGDSWAAWRVMLIAIVGEQLTDDERVVFETLTGRPHEPGEPVEEFDIWLDDVE